MVAVAPQPDAAVASPPDAVAHFRRWYYAAVLHAIDGAFASAGDEGDVLARFPFLAGYLSELARSGLDGLSLHEGRAHWQAALRAWEADAPGHLPLRAVREQAGLDELAVTLLLIAGLGEEDARFGALFEALHGTPGARRPTAGLLASWEADPHAPGATRDALRQLLDQGLVRPVNPEAPRAEWALQVVPTLWEALRGERHAAPAPGLRYHPPDALVDLAALILPEALAWRPEAIPPLLAQGGASAIVVRGPRHSGRLTLIGAVARALGSGLLETSAAALGSGEAGLALGPLATALHALPVLRLDPAPGETVALPPLAGYAGPLGITLGQGGGVGGAAVQRAIHLATEIPTPLLRRRHWAAGFAGQPPPDLAALGDRVRLPGGTIRRAAALAQAQAALDGRGVATLADVRAACASLNREALDTLARRLPPLGEGDLLAVEAATARDLRDLERRCRHRERLGDAVGAALGQQLTPGVRALFTGPSGTGKTLAARRLGAALGLDLYRVDLAAVVNKYIGETEKRLDELFSRAEELDVLLLLDEGDALLTTRTAVQTANDRYANLETNFLLQRLEAYSGILIVTTNAGERIDAAFQRRMDAVVAFRPPGPAERWAIWHGHLPERHAVDGTFLEQVARRCELHGGQIRNAVLAAALLALDEGGVLGTRQLEAAIAREYRKANAPCPLRLGTREAGGGG